MYARTNISIERCVGAASANEAPPPLHFARQKSRPVVGDQKFSFRNNLKPLNGLAALRGVNVVISRASSISSSNHFNDCRIELK
jgi:hypothetical protein